MLPSSLLPLLIGGAAVVVKAANSATEPCALVSKQIQTQLKNGGSIRVDAETALACLNSVPLDVDEGKALINELKLYLGWQSSIEYYSRPPPGYNEDVIDIFSTLDGILANLDRGNYTSEYDLHYDIQLAITFAYDFHLVFDTDIMNVFAFTRGALGEFALISVSSDGQEVPKLYNFYEWNSKNGVLGSPVVKINGQDADTYLDYWARFSPWHDADARYNRQMVQLSQFPPVGNAAADFIQSDVFDERFPAETTVVHANGTEFVYKNYAVLVGDDVITKFSNGIADGPAFFKAFCNLPDGYPDVFMQQLNASAAGLLGKRGSAVDEPLGKRGLAKRGLGMDDPHAKLQHPRVEMKKELFQETRKEGALDKRASGPVTRLAFYPEPVIITSDGILSGYYLTGAGYDDVAVLAVYSFFPATSAAAVEFQNKTQDFLRQAKADGKQRLIIDCRGNTGGRIFLGYDLFKQLFPTLTPYGATRFRASDAFDVVGQANERLISKYTYQDALDDLNENKYGGVVMQAWSSLWNYKLNLDADEKPFPSWAAMFGPHEFNHDKFTTLQRYDFTDIFTDDNDIDVSGYGIRAHVLGAQPFEPDNIVLLQDGGCGSTCAIFAELAKTQAKIRQIVVGGTPELAPMQGVGGSKGAQVYALSYVYLQAYQAYSTLGAQSSIDETDIGTLINATRPLRRSSWSDETGSTTSTINLRDNIRKGDATQTPLEFVYEAADCRLFYTNDQMIDVGKLWHTVADARWNGTGCVKGSTGAATSLDGGNSSPASADKPAPGAAAAVRGSGAATAATAAAIALLAAAIL